MNSLEANKKILTYKNTDRRRRKNQIVAQRIFDRARKQNAQNRGANHRESGTFPSLASRVDQFGISKV